MSTRLASGAKGQVKGGYFVPDAHLLYSAQVLTQQLYSKVITSLRDLAGGGLIMLPSGVTDFANPEIAGLIAKTQQSPVATSEERVKFFKLAWDAVGSEFASRHVQYEMFYAGATFVTKGHSFRTYDWNGATDMVDGLLQSYAMPSWACRHATISWLHFHWLMEPPRKEGTYPRMRCWASFFVALWR